MRDFPLSEGATKRTIFVTTAILAAAYAVRKRRTQKAKRSELQDAIDEEDAVAEAQRALDEIFDENPDLDIPGMAYTASQAERMLKAACTKALSHLEGT